MNKEEFLNALRSALAGLPQEDIEERLAFYSESIDDRVEDRVEGASKETMNQEWKVYKAEAYAESRN